MQILASAAALSLSDNNTMLPSGYFKTPSLPPSKKDPSERTEEDLKKLEKAEAKRKRKSKEKL